jgi:hypothetical protein
LAILFLAAKPGAQQTILFFSFSATDAQRTCGISNPFLWSRSVTVSNLIFGQEIKTIFTLCLNMFFLAKIAKNKKRLALFGNII